MKLRIATRGSRLALWQARWVKDLLEARGGGIQVEIREFSTAGDRIQDRPLRQIGGKGLFVKEIQRALLEDEADLAVHSLKDYPGENPPELELAAFLPREDPRDALVFKPGRAPRPDASLRVGTGSLRRRFQAEALFPGWSLEELRGNVPTRLKKVLEGPLDGAVLAAAGLRRLGLEEHITRLLEPDACVPAAGQGIVAVECRADHREALEILAALDDPAARTAARAERRILERMGASCTTPVGAHARFLHDRLELRVFLADLEGKRRLTHRAEGPPSHPEILADSVWERLEAEGARDLLE